MSFAGISNGEGGGGHAGDQRLAAAVSYSQAEATEREAFAEIGRLGEVEIARVKAWIASGCEGPQPKPDAEARRVLTDKLMAAVETREAAERAAGGRDGRAAEWAS